MHPLFFFALIFSPFVLFSQPIYTVNEKDSFGGSGSDAMRSLLADSNGNRYFVGNSNSADFPTHNAFRANNPGGDFVRSDDDGFSWKRISLPPSAPGSESTPRFFRPASDGFTAYSQSEKGIWRSTDSADSWLLINNREILADLSVDPQNPQRLLGIRFDEVYSSDDGGLSWVLDSAGIPQYRIGIQLSRWVKQVYQSKSAPDLSVAVTLAGLYVRQRGDSRWIQVSEVGYPISFAVGQPGYLYFIQNNQPYRWGPANPSAMPLPHPGPCSGIATHPVLPFTILCSSNLVSTDGGLTWGTKPKTFLSPLMAATNTAWFSVSDDLYRFDLPTHFGRRIYALSGEGRSLYAQADATNDAFITKKSPDGTMLYSTFLGGLGQDLADSAALDPQGNLFIAGRANSFDFEGAYGIDVTTPNINYFGYIVKLSPNGEWLGGYSYEGNSSFYPGPPPIRLSPDGAVYVINGRNEVLRFNHDLTLLELRQNIDPAQLAFVEAIAVAADGTLYLGGYDSRPVEKILHLTRDLKLLDERPLRSGFIVKHLDFDAQQRLYASGWFYRPNQSCLRPLNRDTVISALVTRFPSSGDTSQEVEIRDECDIVLNTTAVHPNGNLALVFNTNQLAISHWNGPVFRANIELGNAQPAWTGTTLSIAGNTQSKIKLLEYTPLLN